MVVPLLAEVIGSGTTWNSLPPAGERMVRSSRQYALKAALRLALPAVVPRVNDNGPERSTATESAPR